MESGESQPTGDQEEPVFAIDFRRYFAAIRKYAWLTAALVVFAIACAVVYTTRMTPIYEAKASVQIEPRLPDLLGTGDMFNVAAGGNNTAEYYKQQKQILGSYTLSKQTIVQFDLTSKILSEAEIKALSREDQIDLATRRLALMITVKYPEQDRIMYVLVKNSDPELATQIANNHVATYVSYAKGLLSLNSTVASEALQTEFNETEMKLRAAEDKIYKFQAENDMVAVTLQEHQNLVSANILNFTQKLNDARANQIAVAARLTEMRKEAKQEVLATPIIMMGDATSFEAIRTMYYTERIRLLEMAKDLGAKNPDYLAQSQKVDELYKAMEGEVKILVNGTEDLYSAATATNNGLAAEVERYKQEAKRLSPKIVQYNEFQREKKLIEDQYNILRARLSTTQMTSNMSAVISNVRPLDPALVPTKPVSPRMSVNVLVAAVLALFGGLGLVLLLVFLDRSIKTALDATLACGAPVLGVIPTLTETEVAKGDLRARDMYIHEHPTSHVAECCRVLRTNVMFSATDHNLKTLVVCSANAQEGKTTTVMYLGTTMAQSGQKVLLIDTDMRRPRLHISTGVAREPGLSTLILGDDNYDDVIKPTAIPNLFVLPCGPLPPNPAELLMTKRFETVLEELGKRFTKIILDSPPLQPVTDAVVLAKRSEGVILVARSGKTVREELKRSAKMIRGVNGVIFGVVLNELDRRDQGSSYYYSYYGYKASEDDAAKPA
ncbi:MAG: polysaccharide biosynthesis tyrosine autokinase [Deltaproteobacteria bacterium]|nr:polysaccharide biosynthesis tyrosine autokinase [Deltaproteobacteria bacterium]